MPTVTGTKAKLSKCPKCGKPLKIYISRFAGRTGVGAVMGSKRLKAIDIVLVS